MIFEILLIPIFSIIEALFSLIPDFGEFPTSLIMSVDHVLDIIFDNLQFLGMFVRVDTIKILVPLVLFVTNFELVYNIIMWILRKIPIIGIS